jgi:hypothetical protein
MRSFSATKLAMSNATTAATGISDEGSILTEIHRYEHTLMSRVLHDDCNRREHWMKRIDVGKVLDHLQGSVEHEAKTPSGFDEVRNTSH